MEQLQVLKIKTLTFNSSLCQWCPWCILSNHCCHRMDWTLHTDSSQLKIQIRTNLISEMFWMNEFEIWTLKLIIIRCTLKISLFSCWKKG
jgi:hypothetical protein